jgi:hypothetical protein
VTRRLGRILAAAAAGAAAVVVLTWLLEAVMPAPFSGFLALCVVGLAVTEVLKRQPRQRALRVLLAYFRARERGADEAEARRRLLARVSRSPAVRQRLAADLEAEWRGKSERERVLRSVAALLAGLRQSVAPQDLAAAYDTARDRFVLPGWDTLPKGFVEAVRRRLDEGEIRQLDELAGTHKLFYQKFFRRPTSLGVEPEASVVDFARLLQSLGNRLGQSDATDAERAYRLALRLRPDGNLAHAGLALLLERHGRVVAASREARLALEVLDEYAGRAADREPTVEDITPFRSPLRLREELQRLATLPPRTSP